MKGGWYRLEMPRERPGWEALGGDWKSSSWEMAGRPAFSHTSSKPKQTFFLRHWPLPKATAQENGKKPALGDTACTTLHLDLCRDNSRGQDYGFEQSQGASVSGLGVELSTPLSQEPDRCFSLREGDRNSWYPADPTGLHTKISTQPRAGKHSGTISE